MAVPFSVGKVEELVDGRIYVEWETVADDGRPLIEGDYFDIPADEDAIAEALEDVKTRRQRFNDAPKQAPRREPPRKRTTAVLDEQTVNRIKSRIAQ